MKGYTLYKSKLPKDAMVVYKNKINTTTCTERIMVFTITKVILMLISKISEFISKLKSQVGKYIIEYINT